MQKSKIFEEVESKMMRSLEDLYSIQALLKGTSRYFYNEPLCSDDKHQEYQKKWIESKEELEELKKKYESAISKLDSVRLENTAIKETVNQLNNSLGIERVKLIQLESTKNSTHQELLQLKQTIMQKDHTIETYQNSMDKKTLEINQLYDIIDTSRSATLKNKGLLRKSRIPVRSISLCSINCSTSMCSDLASKSQKDKCIHQQKYTQNKDLIKALDRSEKDTDFTK